MRFEITVIRDRYHWKLLAFNGATIAESTSVGYERLVECEESIRMVRKNARAARVVHVQP